MKYHGTQIFHLYIVGFSEKSIEYITGFIKYEVKFVEFEDLSKKHHLSTK